MQKQLLDSKVVRAGELDDCHIRDRKLIKHGLELPILVLPEDDPPLIELRQRGGKTLSECKLDGFCGHGALPPLSVGISHFAIRAKAISRHAAVDNWIQLFIICITGWTIVDVLSRGNL